MWHRIISDFSKGILWETPWDTESFQISVKAYYGKHHGTQNHFRF